MKLTRQYLLLSVLGLIALLKAGDWLLNSAIQEPLQQRRARSQQLQAEIAKKEKLIAETRNAGKQIAAWQKQSLPSDPEVARTAYRSWLLQQVKAARLRNAVVDSGAPSARRTRSGELLYRTMPFSIRCRGSLSEFNTFLFQFTRAGHLHQVSSLTLSPVAETGQFEISVGVETLLLSGRKSSELNTGESHLLSSGTLAEYASIAGDNIFGVGIDGSDPMKHTVITAIIFSDGNPQVWITEELSGRTVRIGLNEPFSTVALSGSVISATDRSVIIEAGSDRLVCDIGKPFSESTPLTDNASPAAAQ